MHRYNRSNFDEMVRSWLGHVARIRMTEHVLLVAPTPYDCDVMGAYAPCVVHPVKEAKYKLHPGDFRWLWSYGLLRTGRDVIQMDADAFLLENPVPHFPTDKEILGLTDKWHDGFPNPGYCKFEGHPCQSTGFTFMRSTERVKATLLQFLQDQATHGGWEQMMWQPYVWKLANESVYANLPSRGLHSFANWPVVDMALKKRESFHLVLLHMGDVQGENKRNIFKCAQLWFDARHEWLA